jgi:hypothetical protein
VVNGSRGEVYPQVSSQNEAWIRPKKAWVSVHFWHLLTIMLVSSWTLYGLCWASFLGQTFSTRRFGVVLGLCWGVWGSFGAHLRLCWGLCWATQRLNSGSYWAIWSYIGLMLGHAWAMLGSSWAIWSHIEAILGSSSAIWSHLEPMLGHAEAMLGWSWAIWNCFLLERFDSHLPVAANLDFNQIVLIYIC